MKDEYLKEKVIRELLRYSGTLKDDKVRETLQKWSVCIGRSLIPLNWTDIMAQVDFDFIIFPLSEFKEEIIEKIIWKKDDLAPFFSKLSHLQWDSSYLYGYNYSTEEITVYNLSNKEDIDKFISDINIPDIMDYIINEREEMELFSIFISGDKTEEYWEDWRSLNLF